MTRPGPKRKVSDSRLLFEILVSGEGSVFASEIEPNVSLKTTQGVRDRLNNIVDDTEYLSMRKVSGRNLYSLTDEGREMVLEKVRSQID